MKSWRYDMHMSGPPNKRDLFVTKVKCMGLICYATFYK